MDVLITECETMEDVFFKPIDNLWGLHGIRAKLAVNLSGEYDKASLFLPVFDEEGNEIDLSEYIKNLQNSDSPTLGLAFTIEKIIESVNVERKDEELENLITGFRVVITTVTRKNISELGCRPMTVNQISPILFMQKEVILRASKKVILEASDNLVDGEKKRMVLRIGQYRDGRYVLFLHGSENETNYPVRIPSGR